MTSLLIVILVAAWFVLAALILGAPAQKKVARSRRHQFARLIVGRGLSNRAANRVAHSIRMNRHILVGGSSLAIAQARAGLSSLVRDLFGSLAEATVEGARIRRSYRESSALVRSVYALNQNQLGRKVAQVRKSLGIHIEVISTSNHQNRKNHSARRQAYRALLNERMAAIPSTIISINENVASVRRVGSNVSPREGTWAWATRAQRAIQARKNENRTEQLIAQDIAWVRERAKTINIDGYEVGLASILPELMYPDIETKKTTPRLYGEISRRTVRAHCQTTVAGRPVAIELRVA